MWWCDNCAVCVCEHTVPLDVCGGVTTVLCVCVCEHTVPLDVCGGVTTVLCVCVCM